MGRPLYQNYHRVGPIPLIRKIGGQGNNSVQGRVVSVAGHLTKTFCSSYTGTTEILANSRQSKDQPGREGLPWVQALNKKFL